MESKNFKKSSMIGDMSYISYPNIRPLAQKLNDPAPKRWGGLSTGWRRTPELFFENNPSKSNFECFQRYILFRSRAIFFRKIFGWKSYQKPRQKWNALVPALVLGLGIQKTSLVFNKFVVCCFVYMFFFISFFLHWLLKLDNIVI